MKVKHKNLTVLWNIHNYLLDICSNYGINPSDLKKVKELQREEKYIFSKLNSTIKKATEAYDSYRLNEIPVLLEDLFLELSRTYIQLIREKASLGDEEDKKQVAFTIFRVLLDTLKMFSTICPFITDQMYLDLKQQFDLEHESIHLFEWPACKESLIDVELESEISTAEDIIQSMLAAREKLQRGVRWPVKQVIVVTKDAQTKANIEKARDMILSQTNTKELTIVNELDTIRKKVKSDFRTLGPDFGEDSPKIIAKLTQESADTVIEHLEKDGIHKIEIDGKQLQLKKHHLLIERISPENLQEASFRQGFVYLNKEMDDNLEAEGFSRELMRRVQSLRKKAGLEKKDSILLAVKADEDLVLMFKKWEDLILEKCGISKLKISEDGPARKLAHKSKEKVKGKEFEISLEKSSS
jgi:isoleucyl-tRNA synthetase